MATKLDYQEGLTDEYQGKGGGIMQEYMIITQRGEKIFFVTYSFASAWDQVQAYIHRNSADAFQVFAANRGVGPKWSLILRNTGGSAQ